MGDFTPTNHILSELLLRTAQILPDNDNQALTLIQRDGAVLHLVLDEEDYWVGKMEFKEC